MNASSYRREAARPPKQRGCTKLNVSRVSYEWTISDFSLRPEESREKLMSPEFHSANNSEKWRLELYPRGADEANKHNVSLFLKLVESSAEVGFNLQCKLSILKPPNNTKLNIKRFFRKYVTGTTLGYLSYVSRASLLNTAQGLVVNDALTICCEIEIPMDTVNESFDEAAPPLSLNIVSRRLSDDLQQLLNESKFTDFNIIAGDAKFHVHKLILASRSSVFANMFDHQLRDEKNDVLQIDDMPPVVVKGMLQFIYTDEVPDIEEMTLEYLAAAEKYDLNGLKDKCQEVLFKNLCEQNAADFLIIADRFNAGDLKVKIIEFIANRLQSVVRTEGYRELERSHSGLLGDIIRAKVNNM